MEEYSRMQIQEMCKLAMPNGLKDLMADISREVLRAQPANLYSFIAQYLKALLRARESLCIASQLCCDICDNIPHPPLDEALKEMGFSDDDIDTIVKTVTKFLEKSDSKESIVREDSIVARLIRKVEIPEEQIDEVTKLIRRSYLLHKLECMPENFCLPITKREDSSFDDDSTRAKRYSEDTKTSIASQIRAKSPSPTEELSTDSNEVEVHEIDYKVSFDQEYIKQAEKPAALIKNTSNIRKSIEAAKKESTTSDGNLKSISFHDKDERIVYDAAQEADDESNNSSVVDESIVPESDHDDDDYTSIIDDEISSLQSILRDDY